MPEREPLPPYFDPHYQPTQDELAGDSWSACYGPSVIVLQPESMETPDAHH